MSTGDNNQNGYYRTDNTVFDDLNLDNANIDIDWDTFTLDTSSMPGCNITYSNIQTSVGSGNVTISNGGSASGSMLTSNGFNGNAWSTNITTSPTPSLHVSGDAEFEGDVKIKGRNLAEVLDTICDRLAILTPDPKKLEKYAALKKAYDHYKTLEALINHDDTGSQGQ